jgi:hypothetical protein
MTLRESILTVWKWLFIRYTLLFSFSWRFLRLVFCIFLLLFLPQANQDVRASSGEFSDAVKAFKEGNYETALEIWLDLSDSGHAVAMQNVGYMLRMGLGHKADPKAGFKWHLKAAELGVAEAQVSVSIMLLSGEGTEKSPRDSLRWMWKAAKAGLPPAQYNVGVMLEYGLRFDTESTHSSEIPSAIYWHRLAASNGHEPARKHLQQMYPDDTQPNDSIELLTLEPFKTPTLSPLFFRSISQNTPFRDIFVPIPSPYRKSFMLDYENLLN